MHPIMHSTQRNQVWEMIYHKEVGYSGHQLSPRHSSMVISKPQPSVLHPFGETSSFEMLMSLKLTHFVKTFHTNAS